MTKALKKAIATRSRLENKSIESKLAYKKQRNVCSRLYKKERKTYYTKFNITNITDNRKFWKTMKLFFSDKGVNTGKITLIEDNKITSIPNNKSVTPPFANNAFGFTFNLLHIFIKIFSVIGNASPQTSHLILNHYLNFLCNLLG